MAQDDGQWFPGRVAAEDPARVALIATSDGSSSTYAEIDELANRMARFLHDRGLGTSDHITMWFDNDLDYPALWWGAHYAGVYYTLMSARLTAEEAAYIVGDSGSTVVILGARLAAEHGDALRSLVGDSVELVADVDGPDGLRARLAAVSPAPLTDRVEGSVMLYSSGTTGVPKAVKRGRTLAPLGTSGGAIPMARMFGVDEQSVYLSPAPLYHAAPYGYVAAMTGLGATAVIMDHFDAEGFLAAVERYRVTHVQVVPTMFVRLLALPDDVRARYDLSSLRAVIHAAAPCPRPVKEAMFAWLGPIVHEYYAGTEGVGFTICGPDDWLAHPGSVGRPLTGAIHVVGDDGEELPTGEDGVVYFETSARLEYHNDPEKSRAAHHAQGWATYGDIGHVDADGFLYLTDRRADLILVGGVNVYPQEAENLLISHPSVLDAAVFGIPHAELGEEVFAVVEPAAGVAPGPELEAELIAHCRAHLARVKCPRSIDFRDDLPREPTGKLLKRRLRDEYRATA